jgi:hypothetical protein
MERMHKLEEEHKKKEKEIAEKEREEDDKKDSLGIYRYVHFICVRSKFVCDRRDEGSIQEHKENCEYCIANKLEGKS